MTDEPTPDHGVDPLEEPRRSSYEDISSFDVSLSASAVVAGRRTPTLITAAVVLFAGAVFAVLYVVVLLPFASSSGRSSISGGVVAFLIVYGIVQAIAGALVLMLRPAGRWLGTAIAIVGVGLGVARASTTPASGLVSILLNAFVIYALASSGPSFRRG